MLLNFQRYELNLLWVWSLPDLLYVVASVANVDISQHLEMGKKLLAAGQLAEALSHYHAVIDSDPNNYMSLYARATVYLAMGKSKAALSDLERVTQLKPDFTAAWKQRAHVLLKQGRLDEAELDLLEMAELRGSKDDEVKGELARIAELRGLMSEGRAWATSGNHDAAIGLFSRVIESCPWNVEMKMLRAESYIIRGETFEAIYDLRQTTRLKNDDTEGHLRISNLLYRMGDAGESLTEIRECLKLDPDHHECMKLYRKVKKLAKQLSALQQAKESKDWASCVKEAQKIERTETEVVSFLLRAYSSGCHCLLHAGNPDESVVECDKALDLEQNNVDVLCDKAEAIIQLDDLDEALRLYQTAESVSGDSSRPQEGIRRIQQLKKQASKRDYYKILGVKRSATKQQITKAYRKLAQQWHPDQHEGDAKKEAEKKFMDIAAAKEVLSDPEMRQKFDHGEDPLDAEENSKRGFNPFQGFNFNPFGDGGGGSRDGYTYTFHY